MYFYLNHVMTVSVLEIDKYKILLYVFDPS